MKLICGIALALGILIQPTSSKADYIAILGVGSVTCSEIAERYRQLPSDAEIWMIYWAQGFMSGENTSQLASDGQYRDLGAMTFKAQETSIRNYCDEHPMAEFFKAVLDLYGKLPLEKYTPPTSH
jgi:hypothetical protein